MRVNGYLMVSSTGGLRVNRRTMNPEPNEIALKLEINIPDEFFTRPVAVVEIKVPETALASRNTNLLVNVTAKTVAEAFQVDVTDVYDALLPLLSPSSTEQDTTDETH